MKAGHAITTGRYRVAVGDHRFRDGLSLEADWDVGRAGELPHRVEHRRVRDAYGTALWIIAPLDPEAAERPSDLRECIAAAVRSGRAGR